MIRKFTCTCIFLLVTVTPPVVPVLPDLTAECSITPTAPTTTTDDSGVTITGTTTTPFPITTQGTTPVTWTFDDGNGNIVTAIQNVIIDDVTAPVAPVLSAITAECVAFPATPTAMDACAGPILGTTFTTFPMTGEGTRIITWYFNDGNGNTSTADQQVTIDDVTPPAAPSLSDITAECVAFPPTPTAFDACAGPILGTTFTTFPMTGQGTRVITWYFNDGNGNTSSADQSVTIDDITPPEVPVLPAITAECVAFASAPAAMDACAGLIIGTTFTTFPMTGQGTRTITWYFNDGNGNTSSAEQTVIIDDITPPSISPIPDFAAECRAFPTAPVASDDCAGPIIATTSTVFPITGQGTTIVTWTFNDGNGNITTADQNIVLTPLILSPVTGPNEVNIGSSITLSDETTGGTWTVSNANATIDETSGILAGVAVGTVIATYSFTSAENCFYVVNYDVSVKESSFPVNLVSFNGEKTGFFEAELTWATSEEKEFREFQIQKSSDSKNFETVGIVAGSSISQGSLNYYKFTDKNVAAPANYYRLKLIDDDGTFEFSKIIHLESDAIDNDVIGQVYPNPANKELVAIDVISNKTGSAEMVLYNFAGIALKQQQLRLIIGRNQLIISTDHLANGMYFLKIDINSTSYGRKIVISK